MEKYGFRDSWISGLHRTFGEDCLMMDIDFLAIEYCKDKATALVEYKYEAADVDAFKTSWKREVINEVAGSLPAFLLTYTHQYEGWHLYALNAQAIGYLGRSDMETNAYEYALFLNQIRGINLTEDGKKNVWSAIQNYIASNQFLAQELERNFNEHQ